MAKQVLSRGATGPNSGTGTSPYDAVPIINENFTELYDALAAQLALNTGLAPKNNPIFTGAVQGVTAAMVGLPLVNNTADSAKVVSTPQAAAIALGDGLRLKTSDVYDDFIASGLTIAVPLNSNVTDVVAGVAYANSTRFSVAAALARPFVVSRDTYVEVTGTGTLNYHEKANGVAPDAVPAGSLRFAKVVTDTTKITSVTEMAPRATKGHIVTSSTDANNNTVLVVGGVNYAAIPIDANGNAVVNVSLRKDTLENLLLVADAGEGEIAVATDTDALVRYLGVPSVGVVFGRSPEVGRMLLLLQFVDVAASTDTVIPFFLDGASNTYITSLWDDTNDHFTVPPATFAKQLEVSFEGSFLSAGGTYVELAMQTSSDGGATWTDLFRDVFISSATLNLTFKFNKTFKHNKYGRKARFVVKRDAAGQMLNGGAVVKFLNTPTV